MQRFGVQRFWAGVDLLLVLPMAIPPIADLVLQALAGLNGLFIDGDTVLPDVLGISLMGALAVIWAIARIRLNSKTLMRYDIVGRLYVAGLIVYAVVGMGYAPILLAFLASEIVGSVHQFVAYRREA